MVAPIIAFVFVFMTMFVGVICSLQLRAPTFHYLINEIALYGKLGQRKSSLTARKWFKIDKRYFVHFYMFGAVVDTVLLLVTCAVYKGLYRLPALLSSIVDLVFDVNENESHGSLDAFTTLLTLAVFTVHTYRRLMETLYINIFSDGMINLVIYVIGMVFYPAVCLAILSEGPSLSMGKQGIVPRLKTVQMAGILVLLIASYYQNQSFKILANLRKNSAGRVNTKQHFIPHGGLFNYVSSPHYLMEIVIYIALCAVQNFQNANFHLVLLFVLVNQILCALLAHNWYRNKFEDYPKGRKALVPFVL